MGSVPRIGYVDTTSSGGSGGSVATRAYTNSTAQDDLAEFNEGIFERFQQDVVPLLKDMEASLDTRRQDYYDIAKDTAADTTAQRKAQSELRQSALGVSSTAASPEQLKLKSLGHTQTEALGVNQSVDVADKVNDEVAANLLNIATGVESSAIQNLSNAAGMASSRTQQGIASKSAAQTQNMQGASMMAMMAMMMM